MSDGRLSDSHHQPVLAAEVVDLLVTNVHGAYIDLTAGGGGHLRALARVLAADARLYGVDADPEAVDRTNRSLAGLRQFRRVIHTDFGSIADATAQLEDKTFDGILLDLGISSHQLDDPSRGVSFRYDGPLDMRFDPSRGTAAHELVNSLGEKQLAALLRDFGEERQAARIARQIVRERQEGMILTTGQLRDIVLSVVRPPHQNKSLARVFQALRIAVNREMEQLDAVLPASIDRLAIGGRLAVISYHSLEDRRVKRFFQERSAIQHVDPLTDLNTIDPSPRVKRVTRKSVTPTPVEIEVNPRSRSARLRVAERIT